MNYCAVCGGRIRLRWASVGDGKGREWHTHIGCVRREARMGSSIPVPAQRQVMAQVDHRG